MITHSFAPVTTNRCPNSVEHQRFSTLFFDRGSEEDCQRKPAATQESETMDPLLNLACGCLGLMTLTVVMGVLNFLTKMWIHDCAPLDVHSFAQIFGGS